MGLGGGGAQETVGLGGDAVWETVGLGGDAGREAMGLGELARSPRCKELGRDWPASDIYDKVSGEIQKKGYDCECLGGGRISHQSQDRKIHVYGYSMGYGRAQHSVSTEKIKAKYPDYEVTWADDGY
nr:PREDICTED: 14 kDa phosphohistidine phosphatase [Bos mutus]